MHCTQANLFHMIFTRTEQIESVTEFTWNSCESSILVKFTRVVCMQFMLSEFLVKMMLISCEARLTRISRENHVNFMWSSINTNFTWKISACVGCLLPVWSYDPALVYMYLHVSIKTLNFHLTYSSFMTILFMMIMKCMWLH